MTARPFVLVHGAWHGGWAWDGVAAPLRRAGHGVLAVDLPGAGPHAIPPDADPQDPDAFAAAPSAAVHITQAARTDALVAALKTQARPAILVAHSFGGVTVTAAAEALADRVAAVVYVAALMLPPGRTAHQAASRPAFARSGVPGLRVADPSRLGASRLNPWSRDTDYRARVCNTLYGGV
ncbi:MAG: alpha/beta fold hydrolase, partial [Pseudomonadota bacterium]